MEECCRLITEYIAKVYHRPLVFLFSTDGRAAQAQLSRNSFLHVERVSEDTVSLTIYNTWGDVMGEEERVSVGCVVVVMDELLDPEVMCHDV